MSESDEIKALKQVHSDSVHAVQQILRGVEAERDTLRADLERVTRERDRMAAMFDQAMTTAHVVAAQRDLFRASRDKVRSELAEAHREKCPDSAAHEATGLRSASQGAGADLIRAYRDAVLDVARGVGVGGQEARTAATRAARAALEARISEGDRAREFMAQVGDARAELRAAISQSAPEALQEATSENERLTAERDEALRIARTHEEESARLRKQRDEARRTVEGLRRVIAGAGHGDDGDGEDETSVSLPDMSWAEVCAALRVYVRSLTRDEPASARDAIAALQEIDRVMRGAGEVAPPDDLLGPAGES